MALRPKKPILEKAVQIVNNNEGSNVRRLAKLLLKECSDVYNVADAIIFIRLAQAKVENDLSVRSQFDWNQRSIQHIDYEKNKAPPTFLSELFTFFKKVFESIFR